MAVEGRNRKSQAYSTTRYDGNAARTLERWEETSARPERRVRHAKRERSALRMREPGKISVFAIVGFAAVLIFGSLMLMSKANLVATNDTSVKLRRELTTLKQEESKLLTKYELAYDLQSIEQQEISSGAMVKLQSGQIQMLELTEPDSVEFYQDTGILSSIKTGAGELLSSIQAYFK